MISNTQGNLVQNHVYKNFKNLTVEELKEIYRIKGEPFSGKNKDELILG